MQLRRAIVRLLRLQQLRVRLLDVGVFSIAGSRSGAAAPYFASARSSAAFCSSELYCSFSRSSSIRIWPATTRSPRSARIRLTTPATSEEIVT